MVIDPVHRGRYKLLKVIRRNLTGHRVDHRDHIRAVFEIDVSGLNANLGAIVHDRLHLFRLVVHIQKDIVAEQMERESERPADQTVKRGVVTDLFFQGFQGLDHDGKTAFRFIQRRKVFHLLPLGQRVAGHGWRHLVGPMQTATQNFSFDLQVEHHRQPVRLIQFIGFLEPFNHQLSGL